MPLWIIETFGNRELTFAFGFITLMTAPFWLAMILLPGSAMVRRLCQPLLFPCLLCGILLYLYWQAWGMGLPAIDGHLYSDLRPFVRHPLVFLALWCNLMILNLFFGMVLFREANRCGLRVWLELILAWITGPLALLVYVPHLLVHTAGRPSAHSRRRRS